MAFLSPASSRKRPRHRRAAEQRNELAPTYLVHRELPPMRFPHLQPARLRPVTPPQYPDPPQARCVETWHHGARHARICPRFVSRCSACSASCFVRTCVIARNFAGAGGVVGLAGKRGVGEAFRWSVCNVCSTRWAKFTGGSASDEASVRSGGLRWIATSNARAWASSSCE